MANTTRFDLQEWAASQSQPWVSVNTAHRDIDQLLAPSVIDRTLTAPPGTPNEGDAYIPASVASGDWLDQEDKLAFYSNGAWVFKSIPVGMLVYDQSDDTVYAWDGSAMNSVGSGGGGGGGDVAVEDNGVQILAAASTLNFTGDGVTVTDAGSGQVDIDIAAGTGGGDGTLDTDIHYIIGEYDVGDVDVEATTVTTNIDCTNAVRVEFLCHRTDTSRGFIAEYSLQDGTLYCVDTSNEGTFTADLTTVATGEFLLEDTTNSVTVERIIVWGKKTIAAAGGGGGGSGALELVETIDATNGGANDLSQLVIAVSGEDKLIIDAEDLSTSGASFPWIRVSQDGGSTYLNTNADYSYTTTGEAVGEYFNDVESTNATGIYIGEATTSGVHHSLTHIMGLQLGARSFFHSSCFSAGASSRINHGRVENTSAITHLAIDANAGTFDGGTIRVYKRSAGGGATITRPRLSDFPTEYKAGTGDGTFTDVSNQGFIIHATAGAGSNSIMRLKTAAVPGAGTDVYTARLKYSTKDTSGSKFPSGGFEIRNSSNGRRIFFGFLQLTGADSLVVAGETRNNTSFDGTLGMNADISENNDIYFRLEISSAGAVDGSYSLDGGSHWWPQFSTTLATFVEAAGGTFDQIGFSARTNNESESSLLVHFYSEDGTIETPVVAGDLNAGWEEIGQYDFGVSGGSAAEFLNVGEYTDIEIYGSQITMTSAGYRRVQYSVDNGVSWYNTSGDYYTIEDTGTRTARTNAGSHSTASSAARDSFSQLSCNIDGHPKIFRHVSTTRPGMFNASLNVVNAIRMVTQDAGGTPIAATSGIVYARGRRS